MPRSPTPVSTPSAAENVYGHAARRTRRIAIFGPRGTGKTCFFASLYGHCADDCAAVTCDHGPTTEYLEHMWKAYESPDNFPAPTPGEVPQRLVFHVAHQDSGRQWDAEILDHAGEFVERSRGRSDNDQFRDIVYAWLRECEATLIFLDSSRGDSEQALERRDEVAVLLQLCREASETGHVNRPLGLVLTKWDSHGRIGDDPAAEARRAQDYLASTPAFRQIHRVVAAFSSVVVFPVSAIGNDRQPQRKPREPYNLLRPIVWALQQSDEGRWQAAEQRAERRPRSLSRSISAYQGLIDGDGITSGPVYERAAPRLAELKRRRGVRRVIGVTAAVAAVLVLLVVASKGWSSYADRQFRAWDAFCANEGDGEASAGRRASLADDLLRWHGFVLSDGQKARLEESRLRDRETERDFGERTDWQDIANERTRAEALGEPQQIGAFADLARHIEAFGEKWGGRKVGQDWSAQLKSVKGFLATKNDQRERYEKAVGQETSLQEKADYAGLIQLWEAYLNSDPRPADYYAEKAQQQLAKWKEGHDTRQLNTLLSDAGKERYTLTIEGCVSFIRKVEQFKRDRYLKDRNGPQADRLIEGALVNADSVAYEEARKAVEKARKSYRVDDIRAARSRIADYLDSPGLPELDGRQRPILMRQVASNRLRDFDRLIEGTKYRLTLKSLFVPKEHLLHSHWSWLATDDFALTLSGPVTYDTREGQTAFKTPTSDTTKDQKLNGREGAVVSLASMQKKYDPGEMEYKLGDKLRVKVWRSGYRGWYSVEGETPDDAYLPSVLKLGFEVKDEDGNPLTVHIDCDGADIPELPRFQGGK